eukprot:3279413-Prymnesium_polylepis.1
MMRVCARLSFWVGIAHAAGVCALARPGRGTRANHNHTGLSDVSARATESDTSVGAPRLRCLQGWGERSPG